MGRASWLASLGVALGLALSAASRAPIPQDYEQVRAHQLAVNRETWETLVQGGFEPHTKTRLHFVYHAPDADQANELKRYLEFERSYGAELFFENDRWMVKGTTDEMPVTLEGLNGWTEWMISAGIRVGCLFDGWGMDP